MQVVVTGVESLHARLTAFPGDLRRGNLDATNRAVSLEARSISAAAPRRTGTLAGSIRSEVTQNADGVRGRVYSLLRYTPFVEGGTAQHGPAQHVFQRGAAQVQAEAEDLYRLAVDAVAERLR